jgi:hypothetical protein
MIHRRVIPAITVIVIIGVAVVGAEVLRPAPVTARTVQRVIVGSVRTPYAAVILVQPSECLSGLAFAEAFARETLRPLVTLRPLALVGSAADLAGVDTLMAIQPEPFAVERAPDALVDLVRAVGYQRTPLLIVADTAGRVRLTAPIPKTATETRALVRQLETLPQ